MERMAEHVGDSEYAEQCRRWFADGSKALEDELWAGSYYLNFYDKETGRKSEEVLAHQLADGHAKSLSVDLPCTYVEGNQVPDFLQRHFVYSSKRYVYVTCLRLNGARCSCRCPHREHRWKHGWYTSQQGCPHKSRSRAM